MKRNGQYLQVVDHLEAMMVRGTLSPGEKVPSLRQLGKQFGLPVATVRRSVDFLREKGSVVIRPGSGAYVSKRHKSFFEDNHRPGVKHKISVFSPSDNIDDSYCAHALRGIQIAAGKDCSLTLHFHDYYNKSNLDFSVLEVVAAESDALLFLGCYDFILKELPLTVPSVGMEVHSSFGGLMSTIALDPLNAAEKACAFFKQRGYRKVKIMSEANEQHKQMPVYHFRHKTFADLWTNYGEVEEIYDISRIGLDNMDDKDCGYFFASDTEYNRLAKTYREKYNKVLLNERCVLSVDGKALVIPGYEAINTIAVDWKAMGIMALEECIRRIKNPGTCSRRIYQDCHLKEYSN